MVTQQLLDYIKQQLEQGIGKEKIRNDLLSNGWQEQDIEEGFRRISNQAGQGPSASKLTPSVSSFPGVWVLLSQAWHIYKKRMGTFLGIMAISIFLPLALIIVIFLIVIGQPYHLIPSFASFGFSLVLILGVLAMLVLEVLIQSWGTVALIYAIKDDQEGIGIIESYRRGWHKILPYWWILFLVGIIVFGGFFLLAVPGIIFLIWFSFASFILIAENLKGMNALLKSKEYVKGRFWGVFWRLLFIWGLVFLVSLALSLAYGILTPFLSGIINFLFWFFVSPLIIAYLFLIYVHLRKLKGEFVFNPSKGKKIIFILIGLLGILLPIFFLLRGLWFLVSRFVTG